MSIASCAIVIVIAMWENSFYCLDHNRPMIIMAGIMNLLHAKCDGCYCYCHAVIVIDNTITFVVANVVAVISLSAYVFLSICVFIYFKWTLAYIK